MRIGQAMERRGNRAGTAGGVHPLPRAHPAARLAASGAAEMLCARDTGGRLHPDALRVMANPALLRLGLCVTPAFIFKETSDVCE